MKTLEEKRQNFWRQGVIRANKRNGIYPKGLSENERAYWRSIRWKHI